MQYGLLGRKLGHSFSKEIHNFLGDYDYKMIEKEPEEIESFMKEDFKAINVTIPYKETVIPYLYEISEDAKKIGSVNTIVRKNGRLYGYNTDFAGFLGMLQKAEIDVKNKKVLILGTGGTSKTAYAVCKSENAKEVFKVSRTKSEETVSYDEAYEKHGDAEIIINTTPLGMFPDNEKTAIDIDKFEKLEGVVDVIYNPLETPILTKARKRNIKFTDGLYMLVRQAVKASELFFDKKYGEEVTDKVYNRILSQKRNIVLVGMPSCGKTTVGKILANSTNRKLVDTDEEIIKQIKTEISDFFEKFGEDEFRKIESEVVKEVAKQSGIIISTGGGAILKEKNVDYLKQNGIVYFLDRPLEKLMPTSDRPTANSFEQIKKRYEERYQKYIDCANYVLKIDDNEKEVANEIERRHKDENCGN